METTLSETISIPLRYKAIKLVIEETLDSLNEVPPNLIEILQERVNSLLNFDITVTQMEIVFSEVMKSQESSLRCKLARLMIGETLETLTEIPSNLIEILQGKLNSALTFDVMIIEDDSDYVENDDKHFMGFYDVTEENGLKIPCCFSVHI